jgi:6-phosphogluconolactonase
MTPNTHIFPDNEALTDALAQHWLRLAKTAIKDKGSFHIALSGGSTPKQLYQQIAENADQSILANSHFYFGDERCVPTDHADSNYLMAKQALFVPAGINDSNIHRVKTELIPEEAARAYEQTLKTHLPDGHFDLLLLGMGDDGHTASLFPSTQALNENQHWVRENHVEKLDTWRITLTYPILNRAIETALLVSGANKANVIADIFLQREHVTYPIEALKPEGKLAWWMDQNAAAQLP